MTNTKVLIKSTEMLPTIYDNCTGMVIRAHRTHTEFWLVRNDRNGETTIFHESQLLDYEDKYHD